MLNFKSLQFKILFIFFIPAIALIYLTYYFVQERYKEVQQSYTYILSSRYVKNASELIHNLQVERGINAGYIVDKNIKNLQKQFNKTDLSYKNFINFINSDKNQNYQTFKNYLDISKPYLNDIIKNIHNISIIRNKILNNKLSFKENINYYSHINQKLLKTIKIFLKLLQKQIDDGFALSKLQEAKEATGLQRAYIYYQLLSKKYNLLDHIKELVLKEKISEDEFFLDADTNSIIIFNNSVKAKTRDKFLKLRDKFLKQKLTYKDAPVWFKAVTNYINELENATKNILQTYIDTSDLMRKNAKRALYITAFLWIISIGAFAILIYILNKLIKSEEELTEELRILAYSFESHEAMTITDANGKIIRVNKAFSEITGYHPSEAIGKNPNILRSDRHDEEFYKEMWRKIHTEGRWDDLIYNKRKNGEVYQERLSITAIKDENDITKYYIAHFFDISELKKTQEKLHYHAHHDYLTSLLNRKAFLERLNEEHSRALRHSLTHALLFIDLDKFKNVNDTYGHKIGDKVLIEVSKRLKQSVRQEDIIARMGGDEFAVLLLDIKGDTCTVAQDVENISKKIISKLKETILVDGAKIHIGASIGIKTFPEGYEKINDIITQADIAMYQAKRDKKGFVFFNQDIELKLKRIKVLKDGLNAALRNNEFEFYFQPQVNPKTFHVGGAELLLRWNHPQRGLLLPKEFIEILSNMEIIKDITLQAFKKACDFIKENEEFQGAISINLRAEELQDNDFIDKLIEFYSEFNFKKSYIELEILENKLIENFDIVISNIKKLKKSGIKIAMDDFGTGYSCLSYLQKLSVDTLKIDRHFIKQIDQKSNQELILAMINMSKNLNIRCVIEGVETKEQLEFIAKNEAEYFQGFYFSKAIKEEEFKKLLKHKDKAPQTQDNQEDTHL